MALFYLYTKISIINMNIKTFCLLLSHTNITFYVKHMLKNLVKIGMRAGFICYIVFMKEKVGLLEIIFVLNKPNLLFLDVADPVLVTY